MQAYNVHIYMYMRLLYSFIIYEIVNFSFFALYSLLLLSFFLYLKSVPIYVIVHVHVHVHNHVCEKSPTWLFILHKIICLFMANVIQSEPYP